MAPAQKSTRAARLTPCGAGVRTVAYTCSVSTCVTPGLGTVIEKSPFFETGEVEGVHEDEEGWEMCKECKGTDGRVRFSFFGKGLIHLIYPYHVDRIAATIILLDLSVIKKLLTPHPWPCMVCRLHLLFQKSYNKKIFLKIAIQVLGSSVSKSDFGIRKYKIRRIFP